MKKKIRRFWFYIRYRLFYDIKYGEGKWGRFYCTIANKYNPLKPGFWRRNKPPKIDMPDGYKKIVPLAYHTGDGWWLHWGALYDGDDSNIWDDMYPEPLCDVTDINDKNDYTIEEWPFFLPCASSADLAKAGFYEV
mgnify:FL=1